MEIRQLEYFVTLAEESNFTRTAEIRATVQSTISAAIRNLEEEFGASLFERSTKRVRLSAAGEAFLPAARDVLRAVAKAHSVAADLAPGVRGTLRVGTMTSFRAIHIPGILSAFARAHPLVDIRLVVSTSGSQGLAESLRNGDLDVALLSLPESSLTGLSARRVGQFPMRLIAPSGRFPENAELSMADLDGASFIDSPRGFGNRMIVDAEFQKRGLSRRVAFEISNVSEIPDFVAEGLGLAIIPRVSLEKVPGAVEVPIRDATLEWPLFIAVPEDSEASRALSAFMRLLEESGDVSRWSFD